MPTQRSPNGTRPSFRNARGSTTCCLGFRRRTHFTRHGYTLTPQGRVVVHSYPHAQAVFFNLYSPYSLDAPSPITPTFTFPAAGPAPASTGPSTRSTPASAAPAPAAPAAQPVGTGLPSVTTVRNLTPDERDHF
eukprot:4668874-Pleurochrysis_carterae.AAC.1